jgi:hypothetical protein
MPHLVGAERVGERGDDERQIRRLVALRAHVPARA